MIVRIPLLISLVALALPAAAAAEPFEFGSPAAVTKAGELRGRIVETRDGEELGRVHDYALDLASGRVAYVVVSVGSFLIDDSLIAVAPDALRESADRDGRLVLESDAASLRAADRFSQGGNWPVRADVVARDAGAAPGEDDPSAAADGAGEAPARGTATISDGSRTATLSAGERSIRMVDEPRKPAAEPGTASRPNAGDRPPPRNRFERLDSDGDGVLNRAEIAHELRRTDSYSDIDRDGDGVIDENEFQALLDGRSVTDEEMGSD